MNIRKLIIIMIAIILNIEFNVIFSLPLRIKKNFTRTIETND